MNKEKLDAFLNDLNIDKRGEFKHDYYIIELEDSDDYARYYTIFDTDDSFELIDVSSMSNEYANVLKYEDEDYTVTLNANFTDDYYSLVIKEKD